MPRDLGNLVWPRTSDSPRGHVSGTEGIYISGRATTTALTSFLVSQLSWSALWPGDRYAMLGPCVVAMAVGTAMALLGYLHYRSRGAPADHAD
jgi:hypothetical protein